ncbi:ion channel [Paractinoplanes maris]|uniref:ion channel n=1 Tax=Paractinoplanes maris TaxID=1734446 RepID=UPI002021F8D4|nr:ion channel [Actinoplanes maris]
MAFGFAYRTVEVLQPGPFFGDSGPATLPDFLFFSFTTLTTTGFGDLVPTGNPGRSLAVLEALTGQLFLVTAVAKVVEAWRPRRRHHPPPE